MCCCSCVSSAGRLPHLPAWIGVQMGAQKMGYFSRDEFKAGLSEVGRRGRRAGDGRRVVRHDFARWARRAHAKHASSLAPPSLRLASCLQPILCSPP